MRMDTHPMSFVTTAQAAVQLHITKETVAAYLRRGWLRGHKIGKYWHIEAESVLRLLRCGVPAR